MNLYEYEDYQKKFRTLHRDDMYHIIRDNDGTGMFQGMVDIFLVAFAIGFRYGKREQVRGSGAINHVNSSAIDTDNQDLIIILMLDRHEGLEREQLWQMVEEYAEGGISILYESLRLSEWVLDLDTIKGLGV